MLNPYFQQGSRSEQNLVQDLINEQLRMYGVEVYYIPRKYLTKNTVIEEVIQSEFSNAYPIEAYVSTYDGYEGQGTLLSKFGIQDLDDLTIIISRDRFENYISPLIKDLPNIELSTRPKEGDLIYFPLGDRIFEIKFIEHEKPFYQLQKNYVYELRCELFRYGSEVVDTGISEIDNNLEDQGYMQTFITAGIGQTADAYTGIVNGALSPFVFSDFGYGYVAPITIGISKSPSGGINAVGVATGKVTYGSGGDEYITIQGVEYVNPGAGYTIAPLVTLSGNQSGLGADATVGIITEGAVGVVTITNSGSNYIEEPTVTFSSPVSGGTTAIGRAILSNNNTISAVRIVNPGSGYTSAPSITFELPNQVGSGNFTYNEVVIGSSSSVTGRVKSWNSSTNELKLYNISGEFINKEIIVGENSGAIHRIVSINTYNIVEQYDENDVIQEEADDIIDFTERNPFGTV